MQHGVPLAERASLAVLAGQPHAVALRGHAGQGQQFGRGPVQRLFAPAIARRFSSNPLQLAVEVETFGHGASDSQVLRQFGRGSTPVSTSSTKHSSWPM